MVLKLSVHEHAEYLDVVLGRYTLPLDDEGLGDTLIRLASKVDNGRLFCLKSGDTVLTKISFRITQFAYSYRMVLL